MKKTALTIAAVFASLNIFAQGTVTFSNLGLNAPVITTVPLTVGTSVIPAGGAAPAGTTFMVALYWAPYPNPDPGPGTMPPPDSAFTQVGLSAPLLAPGIYANGSRQAPIQPPGYLGWFEVKAWSAAFGMTYEAAYQAGLAGQNALVGTTTALKVDTGDPTTTPAGTPATLKGISGISLMPVVPEPAIIGLGLLGGVAMLLLRRRK